MTRRLFLALLFASSLPALANEIPLDDTTIILGERVGPIEKGMTLTGLKTLLGASEVKPAKIPGAEGEELDGVRLYEGSSRELEILFNPEGAEKEIWDIRIIGKAWKFANGLAYEMDVAQVQKVNGRPYKVSGFNWDYGGWCQFEGGKLAGKVSVRFSPMGDIDDSLSGEQAIPSTNPKLLAAKVGVTDITVIFR